MVTLKLLIPAASALLLLMACGKEAPAPAAAPGAAKDSPLTKENLYSFIEKHKSKDFTYIQEAKDFISRDVVLPIVGNQMTKDGNFTFLRTDSAMSYPEGISYVQITCVKASGITSLAVDEKATVKFSSFAVAGVKDNEFRIVPNCTVLSILRSWRGIPITKGTAHGQCDGVAV